MPALPERLVDDTVVARKPGLAVVEGEERVVILDLDRQADPPAVLVDSGRAIWAALSEARTVTDVVASVADRYGQDVGVVGPSVRSFLAEMLERGLLVVEPADA
jgi:hypothetical protein